MHVIYRSQHGDTKQSNVPRTHPVLASAQQWGEVPDFTAMANEALKELDCSDADLRYIANTQNRVYGNMAHLVDRLRYRESPESDLRSNLFAITGQLENLSTSMMLVTQIKHQWDDLKSLVERSGVVLPVSLLREIFKRTLACSSCPGAYLTNNVDFSDSAVIADALSESGAFSIDEDRLSETAPAALFFLSALEGALRTLPRHFLEDSPKGTAWGFAQGDAPLHKYRPVSPKGYSVPTSSKPTWHPGMDAEPAGSLAGVLRRAVITPTKGNVYLNWIWPLPVNDAAAIRVCRRTLPVFLAEVNALLPGGKFTCNFLSLPADGGAFPGVVPHVNMIPQNMATHLQVCYVWDVTYSTSAKGGNPLLHPQGVAESDRSWEGPRAASHHVGTFVRQHFSGISQSYIDKALQRLNAEIANLQDTYDGVLEYPAASRTEFLGVQLQNVLGPSSGRSLLGKGEALGSVFSMPGVSAFDTSAYALSILAVPHLVWQAISSSFNDTEHLFHVSHIPLSHL